MLKIADPSAYVEGYRIPLARSELDGRHEFYVVPDLNKDHRHEPDNPNNLTDAERERWFGKSRLHPGDVTWEALDNVLMPSARPNAVERVNRALHGSENSERFSDMEHKGHPNRAGYTEAQYVPRTVTIYDDKEQALVAAKILRILTMDKNGKGSVASILTEAIESGYDEPVWAVSDTMNLQTHNALRLYFTNLAHHLSPERRKTNQVQSQREVDIRLRPGENWEAFEGVPTLLTLHGRPGVKMFRKLPNGKDDPQDVKQVLRIPKQELPRIVHGVPHDLVIASDGRQYFDPGDKFAAVACLLVGPKGYTFLRTGNTKVIGELIKGEADFAFKPLHASNTFELGRSSAEVVESTISFIANRTLAIGAGATAAVAHGSLIAAGASFYSVFKRISGADPMKNSIKQWVEDRVGPLETAKLYKVWAEREALSAVRVGPPNDIAEKEQDQNVLMTPLGRIEVDQKACRTLFLKKSSPARTMSRFKSQKLPDSMANDFRNYMNREKQWPAAETLGVRNALGPDFFNENGEFYSARNKLAVGFAQWVEEQFASGKTASDMEQSAQRLHKSIDGFHEMLRKTDGLPADASNAMMAAMRASLTKGMGNYLNNKIDRQASERTAARS